MLSLGFAASAGAERDVESVQRIDGAEDVVIYKKPGVYACFPSVVRLEDGTLYASFGTRVRASHIDGTGGSAAYVSRDGGRTWTPHDGAHVIMPHTRCQDGSLVNANAYGWREVPAERKAEFEEKRITVRDVRPGVVAYLQGARVRRSADEGKTWTSEELPLPKHHSMMNYNVASQCVLSGGVRLVSIYGTLWDAPLGQSFVLRSADDGATWTFHAIPPDPEDKVRLNETALAENDRGEVIAMIRNEGRDEGRYLFQSFSRDGGATWSPPQRTGLWGYPAHLLRLEDGRMLCTYGYRRAPMGVRAALSADGGHTWDTDNILVLRCDAKPRHGGNLGYPISIETAPGQIFTIYYIQLEADDDTHVAGTHWRVPPKGKIRMSSEKRDAALAPPAFKSLPLGSIRPAGWLEGQLRIQADGLSGHLDEFWPDIKDSGWIGGKDEGWERMPYWLDGVVPLAYLLDDPALKGKVERYLDYILTHQQEDGWLGPEQSSSRSGKYKPRDPWPLFIIFKVLSQYEEATGDARVIPAMQNALHCLDAQLDERPLFDWNKMRWQDGALCIHWLYQRTGEPWLLDLAAKLHDQGYDWQAHFDDLPFKNRVKIWQLESHVVNNAMAVKTAGVWYRQSGDPADREGAAKAIAELDRYHGQATGLFTGDECFAGKMPSQGTELCAVVEYMFSLEVLAAALGECAFADRLERIAFNALPATFKPDMWAHQYDQQANQVVCKVSKERVWTTNGKDANLFGLEPNYGCCTANMHQGWPKFAAHLWMCSPEGGLAAMAYAPSIVTVDIARAKVTVALETDYPFDETLTFTVRTDTPVTFPLLLRIPEWAEQATVQVGDGEASGAAPGAFHTVSRKWQGDTTVTLRLPMPVRIERRYNDAVAITRGPLVYSLKIGEDWRYLRGEEPHADWEVYPTTKWNYALDIDAENPGKSIRFESRPVGACPFSPDGAPMVATVKGRLLPEWGLEKNAAAPPPQSPAYAGAVTSAEPLEDLTLIPYGCTNLRVTEFPTL